MQTLSLRCLQAAGRLTLTTQKSGYVIDHVAQAGRLLSRLNVGQAFGRPFFAFELGRQDTCPTLTRTGCQPALRNGPSTFCAAG
jgi:hypothetical protein